MAGALAASGGWTVPTPSGVAGSVAGVAGMVAGASPTAGAWTVRFTVGVTGSVVGMAGMGAAGAWTGRSMSDSAASFDGGAGVVVDVSRTAGDWTELLATSVTKGVS